MRTSILLAVVMVSGCSMPAKHSVQTAPTQSITIKEKPPTFTQRLKGHFAKKPKVGATSVIDGTLSP